MVWGNMNLLKSLRNEKGVSTILIVMGVAAILASFILTLQMYVHSRARVVARIRLAYKYTFIMEDAAKMVVLSRIEYFQDQTCGAKNPVSIADPTSGLPDDINICMDDVNFRNRCINGDACICTEGEGDNACAIHSAGLERDYLPKDKRFDETGDEIYAFKSKIADPDLLPALENSIFEKLIPNFDNKFIAFAERVFNREPNKNTAFFMDEAVAAANVGYRYAIPAPSIYAGNPTADTANTTSPYPNAAGLGVGDAFTFRNCGNARCVEIKVCVSAAKERAIGAGATEVCFFQKISRSFLWPHDVAPCNINAAPCLNTGGGGGTADLPSSTEKGSATCAVCPWRDRF
jgi:hypothetical protein